MIQIKKMMNQKKLSKQFEILALLITAIIFSAPSRSESQTVINEPIIIENSLENYERVITTGVPFLLIASDARAAGLGDMGVATSADTYSQQWNPSKYAFSETKSGFGISYTPYLSKLVNDIFLGLSLIHI